MDKNENFCIDDFSMPIQQNIKAESLLKWLA